MRSKIADGVWGACWSACPQSGRGARALSSNYLLFCLVLAYIILELVCVNLASLTPYFLLRRLFSCRPSRTL